MQVHSYCNSFALFNFMQIGKSTHNVEEKGVAGLLCCEYALVLNNNKNVFYKINVQHGYPI